MDQDQRALELLERIEKANRKQVFYARLQFVCTIVAALCCSLLLFAGIRIMPELQATTAQAETVLHNLETVTTELAKADIGGMVADVDALVSTSQVGVEQAMAKINDIDFDSLNDAIKDLSDVIEPIAKFFNSFKFK